MGKTNLTINEIKEQLYILNPNLEILSKKYINYYTDLQVKCKIDNYEWSVKWANLSRNPFTCEKCKENESKKQIEDYILNNNYKFIEVIKFNYDSSIIKIQCEKSHKPYEVKFKDFKAGKRCRICSNEETGKRFAKPLQEAIQAFEDNNYEILDGIDTYKNSKSPFIVECKNGHTSNMSYYQLIHNNGCFECNDYVAKYTYKQIYDIFKSFNCELLTLENEYIDSHQIMHYKCICGNEDYEDIYAIRRRKMCRKCAGYDLPIPKAEVQKMFLDRGCELITDKEYYIKSDVVDYKCVCENITHTNITDFSRIKGCKHCYDLRRSGENSFWWNPNKTDEDRIENRKYLEYNQWRNEVYKRDNYTCQCCGDNTGGNLNAHHKDGHNWCKERRLDIDNGITLCDNCHALNINSFHKIYGFGDNTEEQFNLWINSTLLKS